MAKHKEPTSGNANSPLKPKPIRSLMQTCRAPLSFISPFNVRGLESDSTTHPKEKKRKERGRRENYRGFQIIHMFLSRANWIKGEWKWLTSASNILTHFLPVHTHTASLLPRGLFRFLRNIKLLKLNNNCGKTEDLHTFYLFFWEFLVGTKFSVPGIASNPESLMFMVLYYSINYAAPWWSL